MKEKKLIDGAVKQEKRNYYRPKKRKTIDNKVSEIEDINDFIMRSGEVTQYVIKKPKLDGYYKVGKSYHIHFEKKPNFIHRFFVKVLLGWFWVDQK
jgi:hypothetical protein